MFAGRPIIGLAGGIGAGKSHLARLLEAAGCCRIASDEMIHAAYTHPAVKRALVERFGERILDEGGRIDRRVIADIVFRDTDQRRWLEQLLHPVANQARLEVMEQAARDPAVKAYVWDSPLLFEARLNELCDMVIFVSAPRGDRLKRVAERGWDEAELDRREKVQMPLDKKRQMADHRVCNALADPLTPQRARTLLAGILDRFGAEPSCQVACQAGHESGCNASAQGGCPCQSRQARQTARAATGESGKETAYDSAPPDPA